MAKDKAENAAGGAKGDVVVLGSGQCLAEGCKKKGERANFCNEHYDWFKAGLVNKKVLKPVDFDKKFMAYSNRKKRVA